MTTWLHKQRLQAVHEAVRESGAQNIIPISGAGEPDGGHPDRIGRTLASSDNT